MVTGGLLAHGCLLERLQGAAREERLAHALLFCGPEGVGKRTVACALARELVAGDELAAQVRFDRLAHERFLLYADLDKPVPVLRADLLSPRAGLAEGEIREEELLEAYSVLREEGWIAGFSSARGPGVIDLLERRAEKFLGRKGVPLVDVLEKELAALERSRRSTPLALALARRLFSTGTSQVLYRRSLGIELIHGRGEGAAFRSVASLLGTAAGEGFRVVVFDDAHRMTEAAENAFLKTLEEPPPRTLLVLVTSEPLSLLATTLSRCARVVFDGIPARELERFLVETQGVAPAEAPLLATLAEGSLGRALELRDMDLGVRCREVEELLPAVAAGDLGSVLTRVGKRLASAGGGERQREAQRSEARTLLELLALSLRDLVLAATLPDVRPVSGLAPERAREISSRLPVEAWDRLFARTERALADLESHVDPRLACEALFAEALPGPGVAAEAGP